MPATNTVTETWTLCRVAINVPAPSVLLTFAHVVDGEDIGESELLLEGDSLASIMGVPGNPQLSRQADILSQFYGAALAARVISGTLS